MAVADFAKLLNDAIGLDASSIGRSAVERAVLGRASACGVADRDAYWQHVCASPAELQELIEAIVVPETWFFRDRKAFSTLVQLARAGSWATRADGVRRILSLPCSTGEEPYSIAMTLFDAGVPANRFCVDAVDVSANALGVARAAEYGRNSFRGRELGFRGRYFAATASGHLLAESVRRQVQFRQGNLLEREFAAEPTKWDVIFCRNLLIYFDRQTQKRAVRMLERLLTPDGVLLVAPSETGVLLSHGFVPLQPPFDHAFRRASGAVRERSTTIARPRRSIPSRAAAARTTATPTVAVRAIPEPAVASKTETPADTDVLLREAAALANGGHFDEAIARCEQHLARSGPSAELFHLMGLARDASGNPSEAAACYRKALYLDPHHGEVLVHLMLLLENAGKTSEADVLRKRAQRLQRESHLKNVSRL